MYSTIPGPVRVCMSGVRVHLLLRPTADAHVQTLLAVSHNRKRRSCGGYFCCYMAFWLCVVLPLALNLLRPPPPTFVPPPPVERLLFAANWVACDTVVAPACSARMAPVDLDLAQLLTSTTQALAEATNSTSYAELWQHVRHAAMGVVTAGVMAQHAISQAHHAACDHLEGACSAWVCARAQRGACFGPEEGCARLKASCDLAADGAEADAARAAAPGGVGPPANWLPPPSDWEPMVPADADGGAAASGVLSSLRGAHPWLLEGWSASGVHRCAPGVALALDSLNNGVCDCADGSDEPGTAACAGRGGRFWCDTFLGFVGEGTKTAALSGRAAASARVAHGEWIDTGLVDDGRCDCCDCADEIAALAAEKPPGSAATGGCVRGQASRLSMPESWADADGPSALDEAVATVRQARVNASAIIEKMRADVDGMSAYLQRQPRSYQEHQQLQQLHGQYQRLVGALQHGFAPPASVRAATATITRLSAVGASANGQGAAEAHPHQYLPLFGPCVGAELCTGGCSATHDDTKYYWELCPFVHALQAGSEAEREGGRATLVGVFDGWNATNAPSLVAPEADLRAPRAILEYSGGEPCHDGPHRSASVELRCGPVDELVAVDEDGKCRYWFLMRTPHACEVPWKEEEQLEEKAVAEAAAIARAEAGAEAQAKAQRAQQGAMGARGGGGGGRGRGGRVAPRRAPEEAMPSEIDAGGEGDELVENELQKGGGKKRKKKKAKKKKAI